MQALPGAPPGVGSVCRPGHTQATTSSHTPLGPRSAAPPALGPCLPVWTGLSGRLGAGLLRPGGWHPDPHRHTQITGVGWTGRGPLAGLPVAFRGQFPAGSGGGGAAATRAPGTAGNHSDVVGGGAPPLFWNPERVMGPRAADGSRRLRPALEAGAWGWTPRGSRTRSPARGLVLSCRITRFRGPVPPRSIPCGHPCACARARGRRPGVTASHGTSCGPLLSSGDLGCLPGAASARQPSLRSRTRVR